MEIFGFTFSSGQIWMLSICGTLIMALIGYRLSLALQKHNASTAAATAFRNKVLSGLEGIYPIPRVWQPNDYSRFRESVPKVETAAAAFRPFVKRKAEFDAAVNEYCDYCQTKTYEGVTAWDLYPSQRKPGDMGPVERFRTIVEHLLSFTERK